MIKVCDAIMGSGKTSAAISFINAHPEKRFLYISPYLDESKRVRKSCPNTNFWEPNNHSDETGSKIAHTRRLLRNKQNVATTHAALNLYDEGIIDSILENEYTVIIDEALSIVRPAEEITVEDIYDLVSLGYFKESSENEYIRTTKPYRGKMLQEIMRNVGTSTLTIMNSDDPNVKEGKIYKYVFSKEFLKLPNEIYVLTYMFKDSQMELFLRMNGIKYTNIGVIKTKNGYSFSNEGTMVPEYVKDLPKKIHILENRRMNAIGEEAHALSMNWYAANCKGSTEEIKQLKRNLTNYFRTIHRDGVNNYMCGTYKKYWSKIKAKGYGTSDVMFCERSTNKYADKTVLAYPVNIFANASIKAYFARGGVSLSDNAYALSIMIQWIWRSAIRNGEDIYLYIPSRRMRTILKKWLSEVSSSGGDVIGLPPQM